MNSPAVNEAALETSTFDLFNEWLKGWFDGNAHAIGAGQPVTFPAAVLRYQQDKLPQPLGGQVGISLVWVNTSKVIYSWKMSPVPSGNGTNATPARQQVANIKTTWLFMVRSEVENKKNCRSVAELLFAILNNTNAALPLSQKGIHRLRPMPPQLISDGGRRMEKPDLNFCLRMVQCNGVLRYPVLSQVTL
ncbi:MAG TPA: hypothetical protein VGY56_09580 [Verrucomicrobiae bacterium]|nr:hypothetical protein [Verrucomicrobiae bacterium]